MKDPLFSHAAGLSQYSPQAALEVLEGQNIAKANPAYATGKNGEIEKTRDLFQQNTGAAFALMPQYAATVKQAADAVYIAEANRQGIGLDAIDADLYRKAVRVAVGGDPKDPDNTGLLEIGGGWFSDSNKVILPAGVNRPTFERYITALSQDDYDLRRASMGGVAPIDANGKKVDLKKALDEGVLVQLGNGAYTVRMPDGNFLRGGGPSGEYVLMAQPDLIQNVLTTQKWVNPPKPKRELGGPNAFGIYN